MLKFLMSLQRVTLITGLAALASCLFPGADVTAAGSMRCDHRVVDQGMPADEVRKLCGEPTSMEDSGNTWIYDFGPGERLKVVKFVANKVEFIDERSRD
jgi:hypothetical protein